jgi:hypothetical protein
VDLSITTGKMRASAAVATEAKSRRALQIRSASPGLPVLRPVEAKRLDSPLGQSKTEFADPTLGSRNIQEVRDACMITEHLQGRLDQTCMLRIVCVGMPLNQTGQCINKFHSCFSLLHGNTKRGCLHSWLAV